MNKNIARGLVALFLVTAFAACSGMKKDDSSAAPAPAPTAPAPAAPATPGQ